MRKLALVLGVLLFTSSCKESIAPAVATTIAASTPTLSFDALGATASITATVKDQRGDVMPSAIVTFTAAAGGIATVAKSGGATPTTPAAVVQQATVTSVANGNSTITASSGAATLSVPVVVKQAAATLKSLVGDAQTSPVGTTLSTQLGVSVTDRIGAPVADQAVTFAVTQGGGALSVSTTTTNIDGVARTSLTLGVSVGTNAVKASVAGLPDVQFTASAIVAPTALGTINLQAGNLQAIPAGTAVVTRPQVVVRNGVGALASGVPVAFTIRSGGGSVTGATAVTDANGVATVGGWTLGNTPAPNLLDARVTIPGYPTTPVTFTGIGCTVVPAAGFAISVCYTTDMTTSQRAAFENAAARWGNIITADLADLSTSSTGCGASFPTPIDDVVILAAIEPIDGPGAVLGSAGPCIIRAAGRLPAIGSMRFDIADMPNLETRNQLESVILHEMGHVLGIGTLWADRGLLVLPSTDKDTLDTSFSGVAAANAFNLIGGSTYFGGAKVPVENRGGGGTRNGHWRETVLKTELMTGFISAAGIANPLSILTIASLSDIGYTVNLNAADSFALSLMAASQSRSPFGDLPGVTGLQLENDIYLGPLYTAGSDGKVTRIR